MKRTLILPFKSRDDQGNEFDCVLYRSAEDICEYEGYMPEAGVCDTSGFYYGTFDTREPMFCARHFYQKVVYSVQNRGMELVG